MITLNACVPAAGCKIKKKIAEVWSGEESVESQFANFKLNEEGNELKYFSVKKPPVAQLELWYYKQRHK